MESTSAYWLKRLCLWAPVCELWTLIQSLGLNQSLESDSKSGDWSLIQSLIQSLESGVWLRAWSLESDSESGVWFRVWSLIQSLESGVWFRVWSLKSDSESSNADSGQ